MKKNKSPLTQPLSEKELDWLEDYLADLSQAYDDCMTLEAVDGLFCALIINPVMAKPSEWMKTVFGKEHEFKSEAELEKVLNLLIRHWNHISRLIQNPPKDEKDDIYLPLVMEYDEQDPINRLAEQWAVGFHVGMDYCADDWGVFVNDESYYLLAPFLLLELGHNPDKEDEILSYEKRNEVLTMVPAAVYTLFQYWLEKTESDRKKESKVKIGRNDPCPCGSGKKYKKCCEGQVSPTIH